MAFGNGSPDVFGSIASVLSAKKPKADLALGDLLGIYYSIRKTRIVYFKNLGGGCFVTMIVIATIVLTKPFKAEVSFKIPKLAMFQIIIIINYKIGYFYFNFSPSL